MPDITTRNAHHSIPDDSESSTYRYIIVAAKRARPPGSTTAVSCCGANPGMVSFMVKQALLDVAADLKLNAHEPKTKAEWADLMRQAGVKGIHIAERDTQREHSGEHHPHVDADRLRHSAVLGRRT